MKIVPTNIEWATTESGVSMRFARKVGPPVELVLEGRNGPALLTSLLQALQPHFPPASSPDRPFSIVLTSSDNSFQVAVPPESGRVMLMLRGGAMPGMAFGFSVEEARDLGRGLIETADMVSKASSSKN